MPLTVRDYLYDIGSNAGANFASAFSAAQSNKTRREEMAIQQQAQAEQAAALERWREQQDAIARERLQLDEARAGRMEAAEKLKAQSAAEKAMNAEAFQGTFQNSLSDLLAVRPPLLNAGEMRQATPADIGQALSRSISTLKEPGSILEAVRALSGLEEQRRLGQPKAVEATPQSYDAIPVVDPDGNIIRYKVPSNSIAPEKAKSSFSDKYGVGASGSTGTNKITIRNVSPPRPQ